MLGIAKLLPPIVPVKRETLQVVSLAMTGLMPDAFQFFHMKLCDLRADPNKGRHINGKRWPWNAL